MKSMRCWCDERERTSWQYFIVKKWRQFGFPIYQGTPLRRRAGQTHEKLTFICNLRRRQMTPGKRAKTTNPISPNENSFERTKDIDNLVNQSKLYASTCSRRKEREKRNTIAFVYFWLVKIVARFFIRQYLSVARRNQINLELPLSFLLLFNNKHELRTK